MENDRTGLEIAIIGMAGRFPGANSIKELWDKLKNGVESIKFFEDSELEEENIELIKNSKYVKARGMMNDIEDFDAEFFKYSPSIAELMDPQLRILHECAWEALEDSGYNSYKYEGSIGSYIAAATNLQWVAEIINQTDELTNYFELETFNSSEFFSTRLSYNLNLKGPSYTVQTACSSSLVSIHLACQAILCGECDMALAGGVSISEIKKKGYLYQEGMIHSPDGHCRAFDEEAKGTVPSSGIGIIILKRLEDAINDKDNIYAVIKGSAINNDGCDKVGYTAPSIEGEARVIKAAQYAAEVEPESISYIEAHGTGTIIGDPIEIEGLKLAFNSNKKGFCPIGSVKSNIGHLGYAAGVAGVIKTALAINNRLIPPSINFKNANPKIDFENSPFYVNTKLTEWKNDRYPLRAGVSSFGIGGTNAHIILEEPPSLIQDIEQDKCNMILLSARTEPALEESSYKLSEHLKNNREINLKDVEYTLEIGRKHFNNRKMIICSEVEEAINLLQYNGTKKIFFNCVDEDKKVVFMFPGQGSQYINMGIELYENEPIFRNEIDKCFDIMNTIVEWDVKNVIFSRNSNELTINETFATQPIIFIFEYGLAKLLMELGIKPSYMIGHSIGEYVAACISGVLSLEDALRLVSYRGSLMQETEHGSMISVNISEDEIIPLLNSKISVAAVNSSLNCVVSGENKEVSRLEKALEEKGYEYKRIHTSHAFHSIMMEPILSKYKEKMSKLKMNNITIPYLSNVTGNWITNEQVIDAQYWTEHLRETVRFNEGMSKLLKIKKCIFIEVGPGKTLSSYVRANENYVKNQDIINIIKHPKEKISDYYNFLKTIGILWVNGFDIDWVKFNEDKTGRKRIPLPTYPFEHQCFKSENYDNQPLKINENNSNKINKQLYTRNNIKENYIAPRTEIEYRIAEVFEKCLGYEKIGIDENFFELGVDSLKAITIAGVLNKDFEVKINDIFENQTIEHLSKYIVYKKDYLKNIIEDLRKLNQNNLEVFEQLNQSNEFLDKETVLYNEKNNEYKNINISNRKGYQNILLTGATGYLGVYILKDLLQNTNNTIYLIIRADNVSYAEEKLKKKIKYYFGDNLYSKYHKRIVILKGDIQKHNLELEPNIYKELCQNVDCIIHAAGNANHYGKYFDFFEVNVKGTSMMLELCKTGKKKDFNYISTFAIFENARQNNGKYLITEYDFDMGQKCTSYYAKSKFEAEKLVIDAQKEGINCNVFRVGYIVFDSTSGKFQENIEQNAVYSVIKSFKNMGIIPQMERDYDFSFVDYVSRAIVLLFDKEELNNEIYHIYNPHYVSLSELLTIKELGLNIKESTFNEFLDYIHDNYDNDIVYSCLSILRAHIGYNSDTNNDNGHHMRMVSDKTLLLLKMLGFGWCEVNLTHIKKMINHCKMIKFLQ